MKHNIIKTPFFFITIFVFFYISSWAQNINNDNVDRVIGSALEQTKQTFYYDPSYRRLVYPGGDVPHDRGVCTDVVIRAFRKARVDLQVLVHQDMTQAFHAYPKQWGLSRPDPNIDHRRVLNLIKYFERKGKDLPLKGNPQNFFPGDIVAWRLPNGSPHIGIISNVQVPGKDRYLIVHNIGFGTKLEDILFQYKMIGHYRFF